MAEETQQAWTNAFESRDSGAFADAFAEDVVLEATALRKPVSGRANVALVMGAASNIYESVTFTHEAANGARSYVEWVSVMPGVGPLHGTTILVRDEAGKIAKAIIQHRPLDGMLAFSARMGELLADSPIDRDSFYQG
ncbi:MAG TPA: nuclear transport factor 2 family protein [Pseudonocardiaceae bacterium]|nr:nuclear transport factor 2 family protein [Pseudonocardiaceae bacterium]